jgi:hypothetical protein
MKTLVAIFLGATLVVVAAPVATAGPMLSIVADSADPTNLAVGQVVQFDVILAGLPGSVIGGHLDYLAATVSFPVGVLGTPSVPNPGSIIPDLTGFQSDVALGKPDALYDAVFLAVTNMPINANGTFFTFDATALAPGTGSLAFDFLTASDGTNTTIPLDSVALPFVITAIPEPASLVLLLTGLCAAGIARVYPRIIGVFRV